MKVTDSKQDLGLKAAIASPMPGSLVGCGCGGGGDGLKGNLNVLASNASFSSSVAIPARVVSVLTVCVANVGKSRLTLVWPPDSDDFTRVDAGKILRDAAHIFKAGVDAISATVKQELAAKEKSKNANKAAQRVPTKQQAKGANRRAAA